MRIQAAGRLASALALGTGALPRLWALLARRVGLPLEAPRDATRGWDIAALRAGAAGLPPAHAAGLGLFARVLAQARPTAPQPSAPLAQLLTLCSIPHTRSADHMFQHAGQMAALHTQDCKTPK